MVSRANCTSAIKRLSSLPVIAIEHLLAARVPAKISCSPNLTLVFLIFRLLYRYDSKRALIGKKAMFYQSVKHKKACFIGLRIVNVLRV